MLARCKLVASRSHKNESSDRPAKPSTSSNADDPLQSMIRNEARAVVLRTTSNAIPQGRFAADVPGWLGAHWRSMKKTTSVRWTSTSSRRRCRDIPEVLKSAGFMCERCLSRLASANDTAALDKVSLHPRLAMSLDLSARQFARG